MRTPQPPKIPLEIDEDTKDFMNSLEGKIAIVEAVRVQENNIILFGRPGYGAGSPYLKIVRNKETRMQKEIRFKDPIYFIVGSVFSTKYYDLCKGLKDEMEGYVHANLKDIEDKVKDIKVYQGSIEEVGKELKKELERVDTGNSETFLKADDTFWLRAKAYLLGADAIVHYVPGSSTGTPVKYKD